MSSLFANESKLCWQYIYGLAAILIVPSLPDPCTASFALL